MYIDINECDLNNDYFHFSNRNNIESIMENGLIPSRGTASEMVNDRENVSVSEGAKGIIGIINSFIFMFSNLKVNEIPIPYRKYFLEITDYNTNELVGIELASSAVLRKLKEEVYFRVSLDADTLDKARIGGLTGFDINLPNKISKENIQLITSDNNIMTAYDFALYIYEKAKDIEIFREMNEGFFYMFDNTRENDIEVKR